jgi:hypothetical protein
MNKAARSKNRAAFFIVRLIAVARTAIRPGYVVTRRSDLNFQEVRPAPA